MKKIMSKIPYMIAVRSNLLREVIAQKELYPSESVYMSKTINLMQSINYLQGLLLKY